MVEAAGPGREERDEESEPGADEEEVLKGGAERGVKVWEFKGIHCVHDADLS